MHHPSYSRFSSGAKMLTLLNDNPYLLLLLDHFEIDFTVGDQTVGGPQVDLLDLLDAEAARHPLVRQ